MIHTASMSALASRANTRVVSTGKPHIYRSGGTWVVTTTRAYRLDPSTYYMLEKTRLYVALLNGLVSTACVR